MSSPGAEGSSDLSQLTGEFFLGQDQQALPLEGEVLGGMSQQLGGGLGGVRMCSVRGKPTEQLACSFI